MRGIAFDGLDQVRNELGAALELDINAAPGLVRHLARAHQAVEHDDRVKDDRRRDKNDCPKQHDRSAPLCSNNYSCQLRAPTAFADMCTENLTMPRRLRSQATPRRTPWQAHAHARCSSAARSPR